MDLMWFFLLAHLTGDYALQTDRMAADKSHSIGILTSHVAVYVGCIAATLWTFASITSRFQFVSPIVIGSLTLLFAMHWIQDYVKSRKFPASKQAYYADQVLHLAQLYAIRLLVT